MQRVGVRTSPGSDAAQDPAHARLAEAIGYPVMIKATAAVRRACALGARPRPARYLFRGSPGRGGAAFGNPGLYIEKFIDRPAHRDSGAGRPSTACDHLGERDAPIQAATRVCWKNPLARPDLTAPRMGEAAIAAAAMHLLRGGGHVGISCSTAAATSSSMEMNTRIPGGASGHRNGDGCGLEYAEHCALRGRTAHCAGGHPALGPTRSNAASTPRIPRNFRRCRADHRCPFSADRGSASTSVLQPATNSRLLRPVGQVYVLLGARSW